ncbi:MAG: FMN-binding protein [Omnitrophica WOR_2 bacterium RIFCSPHIGHO2_01_FULL_48_9]|nr:MAG: FMN-binding protein [Omnitrophica WOR_2 bacterium RIFCSPHIGHO2_02_FULL_48_11]OGX31464.1 MAG: FMN-binding protein [Omnitrophica WOR_2 bacterium RIFCSPHIGHO2_01_FULL_48_9]
MSVPGIVLLVSAPGFAATYLTVEQAQQVIFPGQNFTAVALILSEENQKALETQYGLPVHSVKQKIWRTEQGGFFIIDKVIGKHELITYAVGINPDGSIRQVEVMDYREAYGDAIRQKRWRRQFIGKTAASSLELDADIKNISGATLSCRHVTEGVKRIMSLYELVLKK